MSLSAIFPRLASTLRLLIDGLKAGIVEFRKASAETADEISRVIHGDDDDPPAAT